MRIDQFNGSSVASPSVGDRVAAAHLSGGVWTDIPVPAEAFTVVGLQTNVTAGGSSQSTATALTGLYAIVAGGSGGGVIVPVPNEPAEATIINRAGGTISAYVPVGHTLETTSSGAAISSGSNLTMVFGGGTAWYTKYNGT